MNDRRKRELCSAVQVRYSGECDEFVRREITIVDNIARVCFDAPRFSQLTPFVSLSRASWVAEFVEKNAE